MLCQYQRVLSRNVNRINPNRLRLKGLIPVEDDLELMPLSPGQTDRQVVASERKLNLRQ